MFYTLDSHSLCVRQDKDVCGFLTDLGIEFFSTQQINTVPQHLALLYDII